VKLQKSSRHTALDEAAIAAVRTWEFRPATRGGQAVPFTISVPMTFNPPVERPDRCFALDEQR
jgi:protein TonB